MTFIDTKFFYVVKGKELNVSKRVQYPFIGD